jgi:hypothetical protein
MSKQRRIGDIERSLSFEQAAKLTVKEGLQIPTFELYALKCLAGAANSGARLEQAISAQVETAARLTRAERKAKHESGKTAVLIILLFLRLNQHVVRKLKEHKLRALLAMQHATCVGFPLLQQSPNLPSEKNRRSGAF